MEKKEEEEEREGRGRGDKEREWRGTNGGNESKKRERKEKRKHKTGGKKSFVRARGTSWYTRKHLKSALFGRFEPRCAH